MQKLFSRLIARLEGKKDMSESLALSLCMAFSGGFQDAYTYIVRGHVFANAQTGNVVLLSSNLLSGNFSMALRYLFPVLAFVSGVLVAENLQYLMRGSRRLHWRQVMILVEAAIMVVVSLMPESLNIPANILVSAACAMQVQSFRTVDGNTYASTMCIGNLRSGTAALSAYLRTRRPEDKIRVLDYYSVILVFAIGSGIGALLSERLGEKTLLFTLIPLAIGFSMMIRPPEAFKNALED